jgi:hypothetical protein
MSTDTQKQTNRVAYLFKSMLALMFSAACLPASAVILFGFDTTTNTSVVVGYSAMPGIIFSNDFPTGSSSPTLSRNLQRAHAWSKTDTETPVYSGITLRQTSLQSNMARAQAFRQN